jgi:hypothetical protein
MRSSSFERQIDSGIASVDASLCAPKALSPFFRVPGLNRTNAVESYLASKSLVTWSADVVGDDWKRIGAREIVRRAMRRLEEKGRGILLLHDIHATTAAALPSLLKELKDRGYHVVQVVADGERPDTVPELSAEANKGRALRVANANDDTQPKTELRHHGKKLIGGKRRKPTVAALHERDYSAGNKNWWRFPF